MRPPSRALSVLIEPVWLGNALARAEALDDEKRKSVEPLAVEANRRHAAAAALNSDSDDLAALELEREALDYAAQALAEARGDDAPDAWAYARQFCNPRDRIDAEAASKAETTRALAPATARRARIGFERVVGRLLRELEWRTPQAIRRQRLQRLMLVLVGVVLLTSLGIRAYRVSSNVALFKPAESSAANTQAELTDGNRKQTVFVHSTTAQWASIDLLGRYRLAHVDVHSGIASPADMMPCVLELSDDGEHWTPVAERKQALGTRETWSIELRGRATRWLRVRHTGAGTLVLSEIEAYAMH